MSEPKYCPLLTMMDKDNLQECLGKSCAWYRSLKFMDRECGDCAVLSITDKLDELK